MAAPPLAAPAGAPSRWRASPARLARLMAGLVLFGTGTALLVAARLGNAPWTVLDQGVAVQTGTPIGLITVAMSFVVLALWLPLRERPGLGTLTNAVVVGLVLDAVLALLPALDRLAERWGALALGICLVAIGSGLYIGVGLGAGPRDGLMTGLHRRTGVRVAAVRAGLELSALALGVVLGGTAGVGTVAFALLIGPAVALALRVLSAAPVGEL